MYKNEHNGDTKVPKRYGQDPKLGKFCYEGPVRSLDDNKNFIFKTGFGLTISNDITKMILEDDVKEFWGFYLLRGSTVRVSTCSRHEGASFSLIKDLKNAKRCSYLGELDSAEESSNLGPWRF